MDERNNNRKKTELNSQNNNNTSNPDKVHKSSTEDIVAKIQENNINNPVSNMTASDNKVLESHNSSGSIDSNIVREKRSDTKKRYVEKENRNTLEAEQEFQESIRKRPGESQNIKDVAQEINSVSDRILNINTSNTSPVPTKGKERTTVASNSIGQTKKTGPELVLNHEGSGGILPSSKYGKQQFGAEGLRFSSNKRVRLAGFASTTTRMIGTSLVMAGTIAVSQTEAGKGLQITVSSAKIGASSAAYIARKRLDRTLRADMVKRFGSGDPTETLRRINRTLQKNGIKPLRGSGSDLANLSTRYLRKLKKSGKVVPPEVIKALKDAKELGTYTAFRRGKRYTNPLRIISRESLQVVTRKLSENEAGQGLRITTTVITRSASVLRRSIMVIRNTANLAFVATRAAYLQSIKIATVKAAKASTKAAVVQVSGNAQKAAKLSNKAVKLSEKAAKRAGRYAKASKNASNIRRALQKVRDPFGIGRWRRLQKLKVKKAIRGFLRNKIPGYKFLSKHLGKIKKFITKIIAKIANVIRAISSALWAVAGGALLIIIAVVLIFLIISSVIGSFDLSNDDKKDIALKTLQECYKADMNRIANLGYDEIEMVYEDIKDEDLYKEKKEEADAQAFYQSSNCAEIMSMAYVWCEHDFSSVTKHKLKDFVKGYWYGSHDIIVQEHIIIEKDEDGNDIERKTATITYKTYYFEDLFECKQKASPSPIQFITEMDDVDGCADSWDQIYVWLRNNGFSFIEACGIMGNLSYETGGCANNNNVNSITKAHFMSHPPDPTHDKSDGYGIFQWINGRRNNIKSYITSFGGDLYSTQSQLKAWKHEIKSDNYEKLQYAKVKACSTPREAGYSFACNVERCGEAYREGRGTMAEKIAGWYSSHEDNWDDLIDEGQQIADYASTFVGKLHYAGDGNSWRGYSLNTKKGGTDCSGFVSLIYKACLPKAKSQNFIGTASGYYDNYYTDYGTTDPKPGDVVVTSSKGHTGIYVGGGKYVNMSWYNCGNCKEKGGPCDNDCKLSDVPDGAYYIRIWEKYK